jgi:hypothetical protein
MVQRAVQKFQHFQILGLANEDGLRALPVRFKEPLYERGPPLAPSTGSAKFRTHAGLILHKNDHI